jgi:hypothetical protein
MQNPSQTEHTLKFLRNAAIELRAIAAETPEPADQLRRIADELKTEVASVTKRAG